MYALTHDVTTKTAIHYALIDVFKNKPTPESIHFILNNGSMFSDNFPGFTMHAATLLCELGMVDWDGHHFNLDEVE